MIEVRPLAAGDRDWLERIVAGDFGTTRVVSCGRVHDVLALPGLVGVLDGERSGAATWSEDGEDGWELVTLNSAAPGRGVGRALLSAAAGAARAAGCRRLWLITTNDNTRALRLYQRMGWDLVALHRGAVDEARRLKPEIPLLGSDGIPLRHELELELRP